VNTTYAKKRKLEPELPTFTSTLISYLRLLFTTQQFIKLHNMYLYQRNCISRRSSLHLGITTPAVRLHHFLRFRTWNI